MNTMTSVSINFTKKYEFNEFGSIKAIFGWILGKSITKHSNGNYDISWEYRKIL